eukprot:CAMPEP_0117438260 /NCGR_PEP_ID=MMETSP0759-20121206/1961_1 /TAXON_ID=63605 /ORGANISM="Percolomonas cosmopolitus, Strain WS" /LENGTH=257 /DNA_ID=CAMNT_0005229945 /DNA_START=261 /DNA_END=1034 /DNA_ORIENTATION=-
MRVFSTILPPIESVLVPSGMLFSFMMVICVLFDAIPMQKEFWIFHSITFFFLCIPASLSCLSGLVFFFIDRMMRAVDKNRPMVPAAVDALLSYFMNLSTALRLIGGMCLFTVNMVYSGELAIFAGFIALIFMGLVTLYIGYAYQAERRKVLPNSALIVTYHVTFLVLEGLCSLLLTIVLIYTLTASALLYTVFGDLIGLLMLLYYLASGMILMLISCVSLISVLLILIPRIMGSDEQESDSAGQSTYRDVEEQPIKV